MAFLLFETGSAKYIKAGTNTRKAMFVSSKEDATPYNDVWKLSSAIENAGVERYKETIVRHSVQGILVENVHD